MLADLLVERCISEGNRFSTSSLSAIPEIRDNHEFYKFKAFDFYHDDEACSDKVVSDIEKLSRILEPAVKDRDTFSMRVDDIIKDTHSYHPLAVLKASMQYGFMVDNCPGPIRWEYPLCSRVKANGLWITPPDKLMAEVKDYFSRNKPSSSFCPDCWDLYVLKQMPGLVDKN
jgi:hypothetical protein